MSGDPELVLSRYVGPRAEVDEVATGMAATRVKVALGSGGARGYAHIGVLEVLEERGYGIASIAGTSMGALVGGLYAAGRMRDHADWARKLTQRDVLHLLDPAFRGPGASIALTSFITPVDIDGRLLADGGLLDPIRVAATAATPAEMTIGVSLAEQHLTGTTGPATPMSAPAPVTAPPGGRESGTIRDNELVRTVTGWFAGIDGKEHEQDDGTEHDAATAVAATGPAPGYAPAPAGMQTVQVMQLSVEGLQAAVTRFRLAANPPDLLITVPRGAARALDFHRAEVLIALDRARAIAALDREPPPPWP